MNTQKTWSPFSHANYDVACGGNETPMLYSDGKTYLYVWNKIDQQHEYYVFDDDVFIPFANAPWNTGNVTCFL